MKILASIFFILCMIGCENHNQIYQIKGEIAGPVSRNDSLQLWLYDDAYNGNRLLEKIPVNGHKYFHFGGSIEHSSLAFIILEHDSIPYYFQLDSIPVKIKIGNNRFQIIDGSDENKDYFKYLNLRQSLITQKKQINSQYIKLIKDTLLTDSAEKVLKTKYYHLNDSLLKLKINIIKKNNIVSKIVKTQYGLKSSDKLK